MRVFEKRVLREIFGAKTDDVTGDWRRLHNEELCDVLFTKYYLGDKTKKNEMGWACGRYAGEERCIQGFGGKV